MSKHSYIEDLKLHLAAVDQAIVESRDALAYAEDHEKVAAAGELAELERERDRLADRLSWLSSLPEGSWPEFKAALREELNALLSVFEPHHTEPQLLQVGRFRLLRALHRRAPPPEPSAAAT